MVSLPGCVRSRAGATTVLQHGTSKATLHKRNDSLLVHRLEELPKARKEVRLVAASSSTTSTILRPSCCAADTAVGGHVCQDGAEEQAKYRELRCVGAC